MNLVLDAEIANRNRSDFKSQRFQRKFESQSASEIATKIASESLEEGEEIATEVAVIQIATISDR